MHLLTKENEMDFQEFWKMNEARLTNKLSCDTWDCDYGGLEEIWNAASWVHTPVRL